MFWLLSAIITNLRNWTRISMFWGGIFWSLEKYKKRESIKFMSHALHISWIYQRRNLDWKNIWFFQWNSWYCLYICSRISGCIWRVSYSQWNQHDCFSRWNTWNVHWFFIHKCCQLYHQLHKIQNWLYTEHTIKLLVK